MDITKIIPFNIRIKTLYWVRKEKEIESDLENLFNKIGEEEYEQGKLMLEKLEIKWSAFDNKYPEWFQLDHLSKFARAEAMISFLDTPLIEQDEDQIECDCNNTPGSFNVSTNEFTCWKCKKVSITKQ